MRREMLGEMAAMRSRLEGVPEPQSRPAEPPPHLSPQELVDRIVHRCSFFGAVENTVHHLGWVYAQLPRALDLVKRRSSWDLLWAAVQPGSGALLLSTPLQPLEASPNIVLVVRGAVVTDQCAATGGEAQRRRTLGLRLDLKPLGAEPLRAQKGPARRSPAWVRLRSPAVAVFGRLVAGLQRAAASYNLPRPRFCESLP